MPTLDSILKQEISRLARKEVRQEYNKLSSELRNLKKTISEQQKTIAQLQKDLSPSKTRTAETSNQEVFQAAENEQKSKVRITSSAIKRLRNKLGISQVQMGKLLSVSTNTIIRWEAGSYTPREPHRLALVELRKIGKQELKKRLEEAGSAAE